MILETDVHEVTYPMSLVQEEVKKLEDQAAECGEKPRSSYKKRHEFGHCVQKMTARRKSRCSTVRW